MEKENSTPADNSNYKRNSRYTLSEDMAILNYMIEDSRYLRSCGIAVWKEAEKLEICPGRPYQSMKERFRKAIVKNIKKYKLEKDIAVKITQFMKANQEGKYRLRIMHSPTLN